MHHSASPATTVKPLTTPAAIRAALVTSTSATMERFTGTKNMDTTPENNVLAGNICAALLRDPMPSKQHKDGGITLSYAHAVRDPFDNSIAKPFEIRKVPATFTVEQDWTVLDGEFIVTVITADGQTFRDSHADRNEAIQLAIYEAEYCLMDRSRLAWRA